MSTIIWTAACVVAWLMIGAVSVAARVYLSEDAFRYNYNPEEWNDDSMLFAIVGGPISALILFGFALSDIAARARDKKTRIAAELEVELAAVRQEVDAFMRREVP